VHTENYASEKRMSSLSQKEKNRKEKLKNEFLPMKKNEHGRFCAQFQLIQKPQTQPEQMKQGHTNSTVSD
jgi:uncharacterized protein YnzC (UPF0291/DUF896 family)